MTSRTPTLCSRELFWKMGRKASLERFGNLSTLAGSSLGILIFLPTHRIHRIPGFARCHDDPQVIARSREVVVRLITKRDHYSPHNVPRPKALKYLYFILLCSPHILHAYQALPFSIQHRLPNHQDRNLSLSWRNPRNSAKHRAGDLWQDLCLPLASPMLGTRRYIPLN